MSENGITMTKIGGETGIATVLDSGTVGSKVGGTIGLIKKEGETLSYSSDGKSWTPLSGGGSGGGGAFDLVKVEITGGSAEEITVQKATGYDAAQDAYTFDGTDVTASGSQFTPKPHGVYAMSASRLIGDPIGSEYGNFCRAYIEGTVLPDYDENSKCHVLTPEWGLYLTSNTRASFSLVRKAGIDVIMPNNGYGIGDDPLDDYPSVYYDDFTDITLSAAFWGGDDGISNKFTVILGFGATTWEGILMAINWYNPISVLGVIGEPTSTDYCYKFEDSSIIGGWHHAAIVYSGSTETATLYIDGSARGNFSKRLNIRVDHKRLYFGGTEGGDELGGCRREMKLWNVALTPAQVQAEFQRCKTLLGINPIA